MIRQAARVAIALALGATILAFGHGTQAAQDAPTPIKDCQTISQPGSYVLERNLTTAGDCLVITASFVTIDLNGFLITGSQTGQGIKAGTGSAPLPGSPLPTSTQFSGLAARNGSISNFAAGVVFDAADHTIVEGLRIEAGEGIRARGIVRKNTLTGIFELGAGIVASGIVVENYVRGFVKGTGISADGTISDNIALDNGQGLIVSAGSTVIGNTAMGNSNGGISAACPSNLTNNTAVGNGQFNLSIGPDCLNVNNLGP